MKEWILTIVGWLGLDIIPRMSAGAQAGLVSGGTIEVGSFTYVGGGILNPGLTMFNLLKQAGIDVVLTPCSRIGNDTNATLIRRWCDQQEVNMEYVRKVRGPSAFNVALTPQGFRVYLYHPGVCAGMRSSDVPDELLRRTRILVCSLVTWTGLWTQEGEELHQLLKRAKSFGCFTVLDLSTAGIGSDAAKEDGGAILKKVLPLCDLFCPSIKEYWQAMRPDEYARIQDQAARGGPSLAEVVKEADVAQDAKWAVEKGGAGACLLRAGKRGACLHIGEKGLELVGIEKQDGDEWLGRTRWVYPAPTKDPVVSELGAGDAFLGSFVGAVVTPSISIASALKVASCYCAKTLRAVDGLSGGATHSLGSLLVSKEFERTRLRDISGPRPVRTVPACRNGRP